MKVGILKNEFDKSHLNWEIACKKYGIEFKHIDLTSTFWLNDAQSDNYDGFLSCPSGREEVYKRMYDERIYILNKILQLFVYPNYDEISVHENKKYLSYWLKANNIPHPETHVFYSEKEAARFLEMTDFPIVAKASIGASGKGVEILKSKDAAIKYLKKGFSTGIKQSWGPNLRMGGYYYRMIRLVKNPSRIINRLQVYQKNYNEVQKGFIILQQYIPHDFEWRIVKIGSSFFGHQKIKHGDKASGTKGINYVCPPGGLLDFVKELCEKYQFNSMAVDLFEDGQGGYLVNELQCIFGHVQSYICEKNGKPGRLNRKKSKWEFEEGMFNNNLSYDLRLENVISLIENLNF